MRLPWRSSRGRASPMALNRPRPRRPARRRGATFVSDGTRQARRRGRPAASSAAPHNCRLPKRAHTIATTRRWMSSAAARSGWSAGRTVGNSDKSECAGRCPRLRAVGERSRGGKARWAGAGAPRRGGDEAESGDQALGVAGADRLAASVEEETSHWDSARPRANSFHFDGATAVGTRPRRRRPLGRVDPRRTPAAVSGPEPAAQASTTPPRPFLGERGGACRRPARRAMFPTVLHRSPSRVPRQVRDQLGVLPRDFLAAPTRRVLRTPGRSRTDAVDGGARVAGRHRRGGNPEWAGSTWWSSPGAPARWPSWIRRRGGWPARRAGPTR